MQQKNLFTRLIILSLSLLFFSAGCGSNNEDVFVATGSTGVRAPVQTANVRLLSTLESARAVPAEVTSFCLVGFNAQGVAIYLEEAPKAPDVLFTDVPVSVRVLTVEYKVDNTVVGIGVVEDVELVPGEEFVISNLDFEDVGDFVNRITMAPVDPSIAAGTTQPFSLTGTRLSGQEIELTQSVTWTSSNPNIATISDQGLAQSLAPGQTEITASYGDLSVSTTLTVTPAVVTGLQVTPPAPTIPFGSQQEFTAEATFSDQTVQDVSNLADWESSQESVAIMTGSLAEAQGAGTTIITATFGSSTAQATLIVNDAPLESITVTPVEPSIPDGTTVQLTATGNYAGNTSRDITNQVDWNSLTPGVASVNATGLVTGNSLGQAVIEVTLDGVTGDTTVTVTDAVVRQVVVTPVNPSVAKGIDQQFTATATYSNDDTQDVTDQANWTSSDTNVATIGMSTGLAESNNIGSTTITATFMGESDDTTLTVTSAVLKEIVLTPVDSSAPKGVEVDFTATGIFSDDDMREISDQVNWSSSDTNVAIINSTGPNPGRAQAVEVGTTTITASSGNVMKSTNFEVTAAVVKSVEVTPTDASIPDGLEQQFQAVATYTDNNTEDVTTQANWNSGTPGVATIGVSTGLATGESEGTSQITATFGGESDQVDLEVTAALITGLNVTPVDPSIPNGTQRQFTATASFSNGTSDDVTNQADWTSNDTDVATVTTGGAARGLASAESEGTADIQASFMGQSDSSTLTVTAATLVSIKVTPEEPSVVEGLEQQFTATATYTDSNTVNVTTQADWSSSSTNAATIGLNTGLATGENPGSTTIEASFGGQTDSTTLTVQGASVVSIEVTPADPSIPKGTQQQFTAIAHFDNNTSDDITDQASWSSSNTNVATITTTGTGRGLATGEDEGTVTITANFDGVDGTTSLTVSAAVVQDLEVTPTDGTVGEGGMLQMTATAIFSDSSTMNVTNTADWISGDTDTATVTTTGGARGEVTGVAEGSANITATFMTFSDTQSVTVTATPLADISNLAPGTYTFNTDNGTLDGIEVDGWNQVDGTVTVERFVVGAGVILNVEGSRAFDVIQTGTEDMRVEGSINFRGSDGGLGSPGGDGGDVVLTTPGASIDLFDGQVDLSGGNGGDATSGPGGNGGDAGTMTLTTDGVSYGGAVFVLRGGRGGDSSGGDGGDGGMGGRATLSVSGGTEEWEVSIGDGGDGGHATGAIGNGGNGGEGGIGAYFGRGGRGGDGGNSVNGNGGNGGDGGDNSLGGSFTPGDGGHGGNGGNSTNGAGGHGGIGKDGDAGGNGGDGGSGGTVGGEGGDGGNGSTDDGGHGGDGGSGTTFGGNGGDGGDGGSGFSNGGNGGHGGVSSDGFAGNGGNGGNALLGFSNGGKGGNGGDGFLQAGDGGDGGEASSSGNGGSGGNGGNSDNGAGGDGGTGKYGRTGGNGGDGGSGSTLGGNGGNGGDSSNGDGGRGGNGGDSSNGDGGDGGNGGDASGTFGNGGAGGAGGDGLTQGGDGGDGGDGGSSGAGGLGGPGGSPGGSAGVDGVAV